MGKFNPVTSSARPGTSDNAALIASKEAHDAEKEDLIRRNQQLAQGAEATLKFPIERHPTLRPELTDVGIDEETEIDYSGYDDIIAASNAQTRRKATEDPRFASDTEVLRTPFPKPTEGNENIGEGQSFYNPQAQQSIIADAKARAEYPDFNALDSKVLDGIETYSDFESAIDQTTRKIAGSQVAPVLREGFDKFAAVVASDGQTDHDLVQDRMSKILTYATFDKLIDLQSRKEEQINRLNEDRKLGTESDGFGGISEDDYQTRVAEIDQMGINTQQDAKDVFESAAQIVGAQMGIPPEQRGTLFADMLPREQSAVLDTALQSLEGNDVLRRNPSGTTWSPTAKFEKVKNSVPDLVQALNQLQEKAPSEIPNPSGKSATAEARRRGPTGRTQADYQTVWNAKVDTAINFFDTQGFQIFTTPTDIELSFLQEVVFYGTELSTDSNTQFAIIGRNGTGTFTSLRQPGIIEQPVISEHPIAGYFKMSLSDFRASFNRTRMSKYALDDEIEAAEKRGDSSFISPNGEAMLTSVVKTDEEIRELFNTINRPGFLNALSPFESRLWIKKFNDATSRFNSAAGSYNRGPLEANAVRGKTLYPHTEQVGQTARLRTTDTTLNSEANPIDRNKKMSTNPFIVQPGTKTDVAKNTKAMMARVLNLEKDIDGEKVKAELLPRTEDRVAIFDNFFGADGKRKADGEVYAKAGELLTRFGEVGWNADKIVSQDGAIAIKEAYEQSKNLKQTPYNLRFLDPFIAGGINPTTGAIVPPTLSADQWQQVAIALGVKKVTSDGDVVHGDAKEAGLHLNTLIALARWQKGLPINGATVVAELDGINNGYAILSILLGEPELAKRAGILNPDFETSGRVVSDGDMRQYINKEAFGVLDALRLNGPDELATEMIDAMETVLTEINDKGKTKLAWKSIIMQAGYGAAFASFDRKWVDELNIDDEIDIDPEIIELSAPLVEPILQSVLAPLENYIRLTKDTGTWASLIGGELTYINSVGMPVVMVKQASEPHQQGPLRLDTVDDIGIEAGVVTDKRLGSDPYRVKYLSRNAEPAYGTPFSKDTERDPSGLRPGKFDPVTAGSLNLARLKGEGKSNKDRFYFYGKIAFEQRNRAPVNPILSEDASVMIKTTNDVVALNARRARNDPLWFLQISDALLVNPASYDKVPSIYNANIQELVSKLDRYGQDIQELNRMKRDAIKTGDPRTAMLLNTMVDTSQEEKNSRSNSFVAIQKRRQEAIKKYELDFGSDQVVDRFLNYADFEKKQRNYNAGLKSLLDEHKVSPDQMEKMFSKLSIFQRHLEKLKGARAEMLRKRTQLIKMAKASRINPSDYPLMLNMT